MKKLIFFTFSICSFLSFSQELVSTSPTMRNALIEEFTAARCGNCPGAHSTATIIENENPGKVISIRYHHGGLASPVGNGPDFRTNFSSPIASEANVIGQPLGVVNRHLFSGQTNTRQSHSQWESSCLEIIEQQAIVNIGAMAIIDSSTNELEIMVELYYTGTQTANTNLLNIALLQNNIEAAQTVYTTPQPNDFLPSGLYSHKHMLRHLITGQWGFEIDLSEGPFISKKFNYNIPEQYRNVPVDLMNLELVIFVNEDHQEVLNTIATTPQFGPLETVSIQDSESILTKVYPNPVSKNTTITVETMNSDVDQLKILDITGSVVYQNNSFTGKITLSLKELNVKAGIYIVQFNQGKESISNQKLIIH